MRTLLIPCAMLVAFAACQDVAAPKPGSLQVIINAPPGTRTGVHVVRADRGVNDHSPYDRWLTSSTTLTGLVAGAYSISSFPIDTTTAYYVPVSSIQFAFVNNGSTTTTTVDYRIDSRQVELFVSGLPAGVQGIVRLGANGDPLPDTITFLFRPGQYHFVTETVVGPGWISYATPRTSWVETVVASEVPESLQVVYQRAIARMSFSVSGLPAGADPLILIYPTIAGRALSVTASGMTTFDSLPIIDYQYHIDSVLVGSTLYGVPAPAGGITLRNGQDTTITVVYSP